MLRLDNIHGVAVIGARKALDKALILHYNDKRRSTEKENAYEVTLFALPSSRASYGAFGRLRPARRER